jgi:hypothetical protein
MDNLISQNINCHSQCDDQIHYYNMSTWTKKSFWRKAHKDIKLMKQSLLITNWESFNGLNLVLMLFTTLIHSLFSEWNPLLIQPLDELHAIFHVVSRFFAELANFLQDLPLLRSLIARLWGRAIIFTCTNS